MLRCACSVPRYTNSLNQHKTSSNMAEYYKGKVHSSNQSRHIFGGVDGTEWFIHSKWIDLVALMELFIHSKRRKEAGNVPINVCDDGCIKIPDFVLSRSKYKGHELLTNAQILVVLVREWYMEHRCHFRGTDLWTAHIPRTQRHSANLLYYAQMWQYHWAGVAEHLSYSHAGQKCEWTEGKKINFLRNIFWVSMSSLPFADGLMGVSSLPNAKAYISYKYVHQWSYLVRDQRRRWDSHRCTGYANDGFKYGQWWIAYAIVRATQAWK